MKIFVSIVIALFCNTLAPITAEAQGLQATIKIDTKNPMADTTSRLLFGGFVEFLLDYINGPNGLWAQEFMDRGFDILNYDNINIGQAWKDYFKNPEDSAQTLPGGYNPNGEYYKKLIGKTTGSKTGVVQTIVATDTVPYTFYVYARTETPGCRLKLEVYDKTMENILFSNQFTETESGWKKFTVSVPALKGHNRLNYLICLEGAGVLDIDEASCVPDDNFMGIRREYYMLFKGMNLGMLRYPGGWYADQLNNKLEYCTGDIDKRKSPNLKVGREYQRMDFGLDEMARFCRVIDCEPQITLNFANGTAEEAGNYVEYCNGGKNTEFGKKRAENGSSEPYNIKFWEVGNEQWGYPTEYAKRYLSFYDKIKEKTPGAKVIIDGNCWDGVKDVDSLFNVVGTKCDYYSYHPAFGVDVDYNHKDTNIYITFVGFPNEMEKMIVSFQEKLVSKNLFPDVMQGTTEWWTTYSSRKLDDWLIDSNTYHSSLMMGLINANMQNIYMRKPDYFKFAERTVGIGLIRRSYKKDGSRSIFGIAPYQALAMMSRHYGSHVFVPEVTVGKYTPEHQEGLAWVSDVPWLDVTATGSNDTLFLSVINRHPSLPVNTSLDINHPVLSTKVYEFSSGYYMDASTPDEPFKIIESQIQATVNNSYSFPPHSLTILAFHCPNLLVVADNNPSSNNLIINHEAGTTEFSVYLSGNYFEQGELSIYDYMGKLCRKLKISGESGFISYSGIELAPGPYIFKISSAHLNYSALVMW